MSFPSAASFLTLEQAVRGLRLPGSFVCLCVWSFPLSSLREYPPITSDQQRQLYKRNFDTGLQEYKSLQAELDEVNKELSRLDKELDDYREESEEYMAAADEYNRLKQVKGSADYKNKRNYCKQLKSKLSHIKKMVGDYDGRRS